MHTTHSRHNTPLQLLIISLNIAPLFTRLFPRASSLQELVDSSAIDPGVTLGASNQPRQPRPQSTMCAQTRAFPLHLCKLAEAMSLVPSDATSPQGCSVSYSCSATREPEQTCCAVIATDADLVLVRRALQLSFESRSEGHILRH